MQRGRANYVRPHKPAGTARPRRPPNVPGCRRFSFEWTAGPVILEDFDHPSDIEAAAVLPRPPLGAATKRGGYRIKSTRVAAYSRARIRIAGDAATAAVWNRGERTPTISRDDPDVGRETSAFLFRPISSSSAPTPTRALHRISPREPGSRCQEPADWLPVFGLALGGRPGRGSGSCRPRGHSPHTADGPAPQPSKQPFDRDKCGAATSNASRAIVSCGPTQRVAIAVSMARSCASGRGAASAPILPTTGEVVDEQEVAS